MCILINLVLNMSNIRFLIWNYKYVYLPLCVSIAVNKQAYFNKPKSD